MKNVFFLLLCISFFLACNKEADQQLALQEDLTAEASFEIPSEIQDQYSKYMFEEVEGTEVDFRNTFANKPIRVRTNGSDTEVVGNCTVVRKDNGAYFRMYVSANAGLVPGEVTRIAMSLANHDADCNLMPFFPINLQFDIVLLGEPTVRADGSLIFTTFLENGDTSRPAFFLPFNRPGMIDAYTAQLFIVIDFGGQPADRDLVSSHPVCP